MADNSVQGGADTIRDLARQAGTVKTQVFQIDAGGATGNAENLITAGQQTMAASLPVTLASNQTAIPISQAVGVFPANSTGSGTLSVSDTAVGAPIGDGSLLSGASPAGSVVALAVPDGMEAWTLLIKGYVSGAIYTEASNNSTNGIDGDWAEVKGRRTGTTVGVESVVYTMVANGYYRGNTAGFKYIRARLIGGVGPTIQWTLSVAGGATFLNSGIPGGSSFVGYSGVSDGTNTANVGPTKSLQVDGPSVAQLVNLNSELLRQVIKTNLILSLMSGVWVDDNDIDYLTL